MPKPISFADFIDELIYKRKGKKHNAIRNGVETQHTSEAGSKDKQTKPAITTCMSSSSRSTILMY